MSRSGCCEGYDYWAMIRWQGAVTSAIRGRRGQAFLREMIAAFDAMPEKRLIQEALEDKHGDVCAIGAVGRARGIDMSGIDPENRENVAHVFGIAESMVAEIAYENDEEFCSETPEERFEWMRRWVVNNLLEGES